MLQPEAFGKQYLQDRLRSEFVLARHMGIAVERADARGLILSAPLAANANHKGTAFGGSLFAVAVLTGWAWITRYLDLAEIAADAVIQESTVRYRVPVQGPLRAHLEPPAAAQVEKFRKMLQRAGRGRIRLTVSIRQGETVATDFEGVFVAALHDSSVAR